MNGIQTHDLCNTCTSAELYQLSYQAKWELANCYEFLYVIAVINHVFNRGFDYHVHQAKGMFLILEISA